MKEKFPKRKPAALQLARAAVLGAGLAGPPAFTGHELVSRAVDTYLERHELNEEAISKYLDELRTRLDSIKARQAVRHRLVEMTERLAESIRTGRLVRDDQFIIESQIKALEAVKTIQSISYWVGLLSLWASLAALFTGTLYRKQKFDELHKQTDYLNQEREKQRADWEKVSALIAHLILTLKAVGENSKSDTLPEGMRGKLVEVEQLFKDTFNKEVDQSDTRE
jgi:hypothetical protein